MKQDVKIRTVNTRNYLVYTYLAVVISLASVFCYMVSGNGKYPGILFDLPDDSVWVVIAFIGLFMCLALMLTFFLLRWSAKYGMHELIFKKESFSIGTTEYKVSELGSIKVLINRNFKDNYGYRSVIRGGSNWLIFKQGNREAKFELFLRTSHVENSFVEIVKGWNEINPNLIIGESKVILEVRIAAFFSSRNRV
tara:strand:+ start:1838 stop:2422 length:585 start_codon:yes stop_codon:yes gene_type:complete